MEVRPGTNHDQIANDVGGTDFELGVIPAAARRIEKNLDHLFVPEAIVASGQRVPWTVVGCVEAEIQRLR